MQDALLLVRQDLGPRAAVLRTREVHRSGLMRWLRGPDRCIEVTASASVVVPSRLPVRAPAPEPPPVKQPVLRPKTPISDSGLELDNDLKLRIDSLHSMVSDLCRQKKSTERVKLPDSLFRLFTDLIDAELPEDLARELVEQVRGEATASELADFRLVQARLVRLLENEIQVAGPIRVVPGRRTVVALVGPTGVGKTTTIAKLAANFRLREKRNVGLITVDTFRIAAVDQLRTYADIIDLPMEVVATPGEMRQALDRLSDMDLILMDTAGRSPRDGEKIHELKSLLAEAQPSAVHLVLSSVASAASLVKTAQQFVSVGVTAVMLTKLDEASGLGHVLPLVRGSRLPLSYLTNGQKVPDDIEAAHGGRLVQAMLRGPRSQTP